MIFALHLQRSGVRQRSGCTPGDERKHGEPRNESNENRELVDAVEHGSRVARLTDRSVRGSAGVACSPRLWMVVLM